MLTNKPGIYSIICLINNKQLIGETNKVKKRLDQHKSRLVNNCHENPYLQNAFNKYGLENFSFTLLEYCELELSKIREDYYCKLHNTHNPKFGYNIRPTGTELKGKFPEETRQKISKSLRNSEKFKKRDSGKGMRGKKHSEETRSKMSYSNTGKKWTQDQKIAQSKRLKGHLISEEIRFKIVNSRKTNGKSWHSEETRKKMSISKKGKKCSLEHKNNMKLARYKPVIQMDMEGGFIREWLGASQVRDELGYSQACITAVCNNKQGRTQHKGYKWQYKQN